MGEKTNTVLRRVVDLIVYSETTAVRFLLVMAAFFWAFLLLMGSTSFDRPIYKYMRIIGSEYQWSAWWTFYAVLMLWRIFTSNKQHQIIVVSINVLGFCLFGGSVTALTMPWIWPFPSALSANFACAIASFWVLIRSDVNAMPGWRGD